mmetsp:Transcript_2962/g.7484  ORF Transcript_2962/g.7484 Transcript_2962/m.7484 type:complete len:99 (+) Transcript_2962:1018-1314(+)
MHAGQPPPCNAQTSAQRLRSAAKLFAHHPNLTSNAHCSFSSFTQSLLASPERNTADRCGEAHERCRWHPAAVLRSRARRAGAQRVRDVTLIAPCRRAP